MSKPGQANSANALGASPWRDLLLKANRGLIALGILALLFIGVYTLGAIQDETPLVILAKDDPIETLYQALLTATVTGVTLVLTISQLVLSQELGAIGDQRQRLEGALAFQDDFEEVADCDVTPAEPSELFRTTLACIEKRTEQFAEHLPDGDANQDVLDDLAANASELAERVEDAEFGQFEVVWIALGLDYSHMMHRVRLLVSDLDEPLGDEAQAAADDLLDLLQMFGVAREHFKTLFFQWELTQLSRWIMVTAIPAILAATFMLTYFQVGQFTGETLGISHAHLMVSLTTTITLVPFSLLIAFMARIMSVTQRTLSVGPFLLRTTD